jgi:hypothetical protein
MTLWGFNMKLHDKASHIFKEADKITEGVLCLEEMPSGEYRIYGTKLACLRLFYHYTNFINKSVKYCNINNKWYLEWKLE